MTRLERRADGRWVISCRGHAARIGKDLSYGDKRAECDCESKAHNSVKSHAECKAAYGTEQSFPGQWIMVSAASGSIQLNRYIDADGNPPGQANAQSQTNNVAKSQTNPILDS